MLVCTVLSYQIIVSWIIQCKHHKIKSNCKQRNLFLLWGFLIFSSGISRATWLRCTGAAPCRCQWRPDTHLLCPPVQHPPAGLGSKDLGARNSSHFCTEPVDGSYSNRWLAVGMRSLPAPRPLPAAPSSPLAQLLPACPNLHRGIPSSSSRHGSNTPLQARLPQAITAHLSLLSWSRK